MNSKSSLLLIFVFYFFHSSIASAKVEGIVTRESLLLQLQFTFGVELGTYGNGLDLTSDLVSKLPVKNNLEELSNSFLNAWTQITFLTCKNYILNNDDKILSSGDLQNDFSHMLRNLSLKAHGNEISNTELALIQEASTSTNKNFNSTKSLSELSDSPQNMKVFIKGCSLVMTNPKVYLIYR